MMLFTVIEAREVILWLNAQVEKSIAAEKARAKIEAEVRVLSESRSLIDLRT